MLALARRTLSCPTAPFHEGAVIAWIREFAADHPHLLLKEDQDHNLELRRRAVRRSAAPLVLAAHMDHPGFRALRSKPTGSHHRVEAVFLGGVRPRFFPGSRARFFADGREFPARVEAIRPPVRRGGDLRVQLAAPGSVPAGALGMWDLPAFRRSRRRPDLLESRVVDDLAGIAAVLALFEVVDEIDPRRRVDVRGLFTRGEEVGFLGALAVADGTRLPPGARIVAIEASQALPEAPQGAGPILRVGDRTSVFDDGLTRWLARVAARLETERGKRFRWQRRLMDGGTCESTAYQLYGYRCAGLCLPLGNYHNMSKRGRIAAENVRLSDLVGLVRFFEGLVVHDRGAPRRGAVDPLRRRLGASLRARRRDLARDPFR